MRLWDRLYESVRSAAEDSLVETVSVGLGYTAVRTDTGGIGLSFTMVDGEAGCTVVPGDLDFEGGPAVDLLSEIRSPRPVLRSMALALINALNYPIAADLPEDRSNDGLFDQLGVGEGSRVAMVGYFGPLMGKLTGRGATVEVVDIGREIGDPAAFNEKLSGWAEVVILTSTSILNGTVDDLLAAMGPEVRVLMMGPSTPMVASAFDGLPVHLLAGTVPVDADAVLKAVRHGKGTPVLQRYSRKVYLALD